MMRKAATFAVQVVATTVIFTACLYLWYLIDHGIKEFDWTLIIQGLAFSLIYVPFSNWWKKSKNKKDNS